GFTARVHLKSASADLTRLGRERDYITRWRASAPRTLGLVDTDSAFATALFAASSQSRNLFRRMDDKQALHQQCRTNTNVRGMNVRSLLECIPSNKSSIISEQATIAFELAERTPPSSAHIAGERHPGRRWRRWGTRLVTLSLCSVDWKVAVYCKQPRLDVVCLQRLPHSSSIRTLWRSARLACVEVGLKEEGIAEPMDRSPLPAWRTPHSSSAA